MRLGLRGLAHLAEHLRRRRLVEAHRVFFGTTDDAHGFEHAQHAEAGDLGRELGLLERELHEAHGAEVVDLVGLHLLDDRDQATTGLAGRRRRSRARGSRSGRAPPWGCSGREPGRTPGSRSPVRNCDRWRPSWPVIPVMSARFTRTTIVGQPSMSPSGASWYRNSAQRWASSASPIASADARRPSSARRKPRLVSCFQRT